MKMPNTNPIETLFLSFCKQLLGVQKQTTNTGVLLELGLVPMLLLAQKKAIKNWYRITTGEQGNALVIESHQGALLRNLSWPVNVENLTSRIGLAQSFTDMDPDIHSQVYQRQLDIFHQNAFADIKKADSKLRT